MGAGVALAVRVTTVEALAGEFLLVDDVPLTMEMTTVSAAAGFATTDEAVG
jgi:hypothetical protein